MASTGTPILPRDAGSEAHGSLTTGAIAGIACGAGALFLGAAGLFVVYWRRQRRYDREDYSDGDSFDERRLPGAMAPAVTYTLDYKMADPQHHEGDHASSYTYSPEKASYTFSPLGAPLGAPDMASAMPTHPAYIPRAFVRGSSTTPSNRSIATASPPPFPSPPYASSSHSKTQPRDTIIQAYMAAATGSQDSAPGESDSSLSGLPIQTRPGTHHHVPTQIPAMIIPQFTSPPRSVVSSTDGTITTTATGSSQAASGLSASAEPGSRRKPRAYPPPPLNLLNNSASDKPLSGKESTTISGPLAFPQHVHHQYLAGNTSNASGGGGGGGKAKSRSRPAASAWPRLHDDSHDTDLFGESEQSQSDSKRTFRSRVRTSWGNATSGFGSSSGGGGGGSGHSKGDGRDKDKGKKHGRKRSDRNSGGGGNRHYAEIEIGRGSDIW